MERVKTLERTIFPLLAPPLVKLLRAAPSWLIDEATELRLRSCQPLMVVTGNKDYLLNTGGRLASCASEAYICSRSDISQTLQLISRNSLYAYEQELKMGYFTVAGGHRIGLAGQAIVAGGDLQALKNISSLNVRLAREIRGVADSILPYVIAGTRQIYSTLLIGPPRSGKTTLLRDLVRQLSCGIPALGFAGVNVGVVDERSEIAACRDGVATADLGPRVDVLDGCPKATGLLMLIRAMGPQAVMTDELGREDDVVAVQEALHAGVSVIASVHGRSVEDIFQRPYIGDLLRLNAFDRYVVLGCSPAVGTVEAVISARQREVLYRRRKEVRECG